MTINLDAYTQVKSKYLEFGVFDGDNKAKLVWGSN